MNTEVDMAGKTTCSRDGSTGSRDGIGWVLVNIGHSCRGPDASITIDDERSRRGEHPDPPARL